MQGKATGWNGRRHAVLLAVFALGLRILIPSGWMPAADRFGLTPCFGTAAAPMTSGSPMAHHAVPRHDGHEQNDQGDKPCAFVAFTCSLATPAPVTPAMAPFVARSFLQTFVAAVSIGTGLAAPPPPPTGPPATA